MNRPNPPSSPEQGKFPLGAKVRHSPQFPFTNHRIKTGTVTGYSRDGRCIYAALDSPKRTCTAYGCSFWELIP